MASTTPSRPNSVIKRDWSPPGNQITSAAHSGPCGFDQLCLLASRHMPALRKASTEEAGIGQRRGQRDNEHVGLVTATQVQQLAV